MPKKRSHGDGALYQVRGGALWRGVVDLGDDPLTGKRRQKYVHGRTQRVAKERLDALRAEIAEHGAPLDKTVTLERWASTWLEAKKRDVDPKTFANYRSLVHQWIAPILGHKRVAAIKPSDIMTVRAAMADAGRSMSSIKGAYTTMTMLLESARVERLCARNVALDVPRPGKRVDKGAVAQKRGSLTTEQVFAILATAAAMPDAAGSRWWFRLLAGQRQGEILGAMIDDLNLDPETPTYRVSWKLEALRRDHGCGEQSDGAWPCAYRRGGSCPQAVWRVPDDFEARHLTGMWHLTRPKSKTGRVAPLIPQLAEAIRRHLVATADVPNPHGLIWRNADGSPITPKQDNEEWRNLLVAAGVISREEARPGVNKITGHWTRHTLITVLASLGVDFQLIGEIVGQSSTQVTEIYRHAQDSEKRAAMTLVGEAWADGLTLPQIKP